MRTPGKKMLLVRFWATWCGSCIHEFPDFEDTYRMYNVRDFELVTVAANMPDEKEFGRAEMLEKVHATSRNLISARTTRLPCKPPLILSGNRRCLTRY